MGDRAANIEEVETVTTANIEAVHAGQFGNAYGLLSWAVYSWQSQNEFSNLLEDDLDSGGTERHVNLNVYEYRFRNSRMTAIGLLYLSGPGGIYFA